MKSLIAVLSLLWFCLAPSFLPPAEPADIVFVNGNVYTVNEKQPRAEAIAVKGDRIVFVGSNANAKRFQGGGTRVIDLRGETVVPGMTDAHYHFIGVGQREMNLNLEGLTNLEAAGVSDTLGLGQNLAEQSGVSHASRRTWRGRQ